DAGVLVLSELAGAANEMGEAVLVNPMDKREVGHAIHTALTMPPEEQKQKSELLQKRLRDYSVSHWVGDFLKQLEEIKEFQVSQSTKHVSEPVLAGIVHRYRKASL